MKKAFKIIGGIIGITLLGIIVLGNIAKIITKPMLEKSTERTEFAQMIERVDRSCPIPAALGKGAVTGVKLEEGYVTYYLSYDPDYTNLLGKLKNDSKMKEGLLMCILCVNAQGNNNGDLVMDLLERQNCGLKIIITESAIGSFEIKATVDEIHSLRERYDLNPHEALYNLLLLRVESEKEELPVEVDEGMYVTNYSLEGENIVIYTQMDENIYSLESLYENQNVIKNVMMEEAISDPGSKALFDLCKVSHSGLVYRLSGNISKESFDIVISSDEIRRNVPTPANACIQ